jgi:hypothetical protein
VPGTHVSPNLPRLRYRQRANANVFTKEITTSARNELAGPVSLAGQDDTMTSFAKLLARKQRLLERLQEDPGTHERYEIERLLTEIDEALALLDESGPGISGDRHE